MERPEDSTPSSGRGPAVATKGPLAPNCRCRRFLRSVVHPSRQQYWYSWPVAPPLLASSMSIPGPRDMPSGPPRSLHPSEGLVRRQPTGELRWPEPDRLVHPRRHPHHRGPIDRRMLIAALMWQHGGVLGRRRRGSICVSVLDAGQSLRMWRAPSTRRRPMGRHQRASQPQISVWRPPGMSQPVSQDLRLSVAKSPILCRTWCPQP
mmetsp:Transcript_18918/g.54528  ORF Transcript_18918/g.54528 Transcript_18918/m.54528 type:complete len:206 (-) Transcript_18918:214-831(-)